MPLTRREAQILSRVSLTLLMLAPRGIEAWLPTTGRPQAVHNHSLITSNPPWDTSTTPLSLLNYSFLWFYTILVNMPVLCGPPKQSHNHLKLSFLNKSCLLLFTLHSCPVFSALFHISLHIFFPCLFD